MSSSISPCAAEIGWAAKQPEPQSRVRGFGSYTATPEAWNPTREGNLMSCLRLPCTPTWPSLDMVATGVLQGKRKRAVAATAPAAPGAGTLSIDAGPRNALIATRPIKTIPQAASHCLASPGTDTRRVRHDRTTWRCPVSTDRARNSPWCWSLPVACYVVDTPNRGLLDTTREETAATPLRTARSRKSPGKCAHP